MRPFDALWLGAAFSSFGVAYLAIACDALAAVLAAITVAIYIFGLHTVETHQHGEHRRRRDPRRHPAMIGWAAARGTLEGGAWSLFVIMVLWQLPHFFSIAWMYREDYSRAGFQMISTDDHTGERSASQSVFFSILLLIIGALPAFLGVVTMFYLPFELILGAVFVAVAMRFLRCVPSPPRVCCSSRRLSICRCS